MSKPFGIDIRDPDAMLAVARGIGLTFTDDQIAELRGILRPAEAETTPADTTPDEPTIVRPK